MMWDKRDNLFDIVKYDDKTIEDVFSAQKVKTYAELWREAYSSIKANMANSYGQDVEIDRDDVSITYKGATLFTTFIIYAKDVSFFWRKNRAESTGIHVSIYFEIAHSNTDNRAGYISVDFIGKAYRMARAHMNSWGYGTRINNGRTPGYSSLTFSASSFGVPSLSVYAILPFTTNMNPPAYLSTISSKCFVSHLSLLFVLVFIFLAILITNRNYIKESFICQI